MSSYKFMLSLKTFTFYWEKFLQLIVSMVFYVFKVIGKA